MRLNETKCVKAFEQTGRCCPGEGHKELLSTPCGQQCEHQVQTSASHGTHARAREQSVAKLLGYPADCPTLLCKISLGFYFTLPQLLPEGPQGFIPHWESLRQLVSWTEWGTTRGHSVGEVWEVLTQPESGSTPVSDTNLA